MRVAAFLVLGVAATAAASTTRFCGTMDEPITSSVRSRSRSCARANASGAPPFIRIQDNVVVMEDDGTLLEHYRPVDIAGRSLTLVPSPGGFDLSLGTATWIPPTGGPLDGTGNGRQLPIPFTFPFGSRNYDEVYVSQRNGVWFEKPRLELGLHDRLEDQYGLYDRSPRISALRQPWLVGTGDLRAYVDFDQTVPASWVRFSWTTNRGRFQVTLDRSGVIRIDWPYLDRDEPLEGAVEVITGNESYWAREQVVAEWPDPAGDVAIPAPAGPALDVTNIRLARIPGTGVARLLIDMVGPPPTSGGYRLIYIVLIAADAAGLADPTYARYITVNDGYVEDPSARFNGSTLEVSIPGWELGIPGPEFSALVYTGLFSPTYEEAETVETSGATLSFMHVSGQIDLTADLPRTTDAPVYESFRLPAPDMYGIRDAYFAAFPGPLPDAIAVYANVYIDTLGEGRHFFGNVQVAGIGQRNDPAAPVVPALLRMQTLDRYFNAPEFRLPFLDHEFLHRFSFEVNIAPEPGLPHPIGLGHTPEWLHPPAAVDVQFSPDRSVMGVTDWTDNGDGTFLAGGDPFPGNPVTFHVWPYGSSFWWVELYLMGLIAPSEVPDFFYIAEYQEIGKVGGKILASGRRRDLGVQHIIGHEGPRVPAYPDAQRDFRVPFVLVVPQGTFQDSQSQRLAEYCLDWERHFPKATWTRGTVSCFHTCARPSESVGNSLRMVKVATEPGRARATWTNTPTPPTNYSVLVASPKVQPFTEVFATGDDGGPGLVLTLDRRPVAYYRVAPRDGQCLGAP